MIASRTSLTDSKSPRLHIDDASLDAISHLLDSDSRNALRSQHIDSLAEQTLEMFGQTDEAVEAWPLEIHNQIHVARRSLPTARVGTEQTDPANAIPAQGLFVRAQQSEDFPPGLPLVSHRGSPPTS